MLSRFDDTTVLDDDLILTSRRSYQRQILVKLLYRHPELSNQGFDFSKSLYFTNYMNRQTAESTYTSLVNSADPRSSEFTLQMEGTIEPSGACTPATLDKQETNVFGRHLAGYSICKKEDEVQSVVDFDDPYFQFSKPRHKESTASSNFEPALDKKEEKREAKPTGKTDKFLSELNDDKNG